MLLIVGGSGYLGGRFSQAMTRAGIKHLISSRRLDLKDPLIRACDFSDIDSVVNALDGITRVLFVAGPGSSHTYKKNDCDLLALDDEFRIFLSGLAKSQVKDIVYISTIHIYGKNLFGSVDEYTKPLPAIDYGKYHLARENSIIDFSKFNQIPFLSLRFSNGIGAPRSPDNNCWTLLVNNLVLSLIKDQKFSFSSSPNTPIDIFPISAAENFLVKLMVSERSLPSKVFNFSMGSSTTLGELSSKISKTFFTHTKTHSEITFPDEVNLLDVRQPKELHIKNTALLKEFNLEPFDSNLIDSEIDNLVKKSICWFPQA
jgi:nucleoside-diphosphate-sugar epimerase